MASIPPGDRRHGLSETPGDSAVTTPLRRDRRRMRTATIVILLAAIVAFVLIVLL
jgi:hypothetical protein